MKNFIVPVKITEVVCVDNKSTGFRIVEILVFSVVDNFIVENLTLIRKDLFFLFSTLTEKIKVKVVSINIDFL